MRNLRRTAHAGRGAVTEDNAFDTVRMPDRVRPIFGIGNLQVIESVVLVIRRMIDASYVVIRAVAINKDIVFASAAPSRTLVAANVMHRAEIIVIVRPVTLLVVAASVIAHHKDIGMTGRAAVHITVAVVIVDLIRIAVFRHLIAFNRAVRAVRRQPDLHVVANCDNDAILHIVAVRIFATAVDMHHVVIRRLFRLATRSNAYREMNINGFDTGRGHVCG
ncbi:hypothetical protein LG58_2179 [Kosakonia radicincitans YD4]|nr:hypothetical protein LG58_2179 [Kosakonia radicincitans YD4]